MTFNSGFVLIEHSVWLGTPEKAIPVNFIHVLMTGFNSYWFILVCSVIVIVSYFFNLVSRRTNFPSVLMLLILGMLIKAGLNLMGYMPVKLDSLLEILGIVGLIMIVLEAALDLKFNKEKNRLIYKALLVSIGSVVGGTMVIAVIIKYFIQSGFFVSMIYAIPLSIVSSAIVIPSVINFKKEKREFMIYEATFSDILGILFFYFAIGSVHFENAGILVASVFINIIVTIVASVALSVLIIFLFQRIRTQVKLFLLLSVLLVLFSVGKLLHLSSLMIILVFGLILENKELVFKRYFKKHIDEDALNHIHVNFKLITLETSFIIRTFFFVVFGMTITLAGIFKLKVLLISGLITVSILVIRFILLKLIIKKKVSDIMFLIPRGLITILLFYSIPEEFQSSAFEPGVLFLTIIFTSIILTFSLLHQKWQQRLKKIPRQPFYEAHGRFIPEEWVPEPTLDHHSRELEQDPDQD